MGEAVQRVEFEGRCVMKAISVQQPWAWALFNGKPVENRIWSASHRGPLLIHAAKKMGDWHAFMKIWEPLGIAVPTVNMLERGGIIGIVDMIDVVHQYDSPWFFGPRGWVFENTRRVEFVPFRGLPGIFDVPEELVKL